MSRSALGRAVPASLVLGLALMIPFEHTIPRVLGLACFLFFIAGGVFVIADPDFLAGYDRREADRSHQSAGPEAPRR